MPLCQLGSLMLSLLVQRIINFSHIKATVFWGLFWQQVSLNFLQWYRFGMGRSLCLLCFILIDINEWNSGKYVICLHIIPILNKWSENKTLQFTKSVFFSYLQKCQYFWIKCKKTNKQKKKKGSTSIHVLTYIIRRVCRIVPRSCYATVVFINTYSFPCPRDISRLLGNDCEGKTCLERFAEKEKYFIEMWILIIWKADNKLTGLT